jgi:hypothetical protein
MNPPASAPEVPAAPPRTAASALPAAPAPSPRAAVATPSLKPTEVITWVKLDRPRLALGEIVLGSFALAGLVLGVSMAAGVILGHFRSKRSGAPGTQSLDLR